MRALVKYAIERGTLCPSLLKRLWYSDFFDPFHKAHVWFTHKYETLERFLYWGWKMRHSYDFDAQYVYEVLHLKLERTHKCMKEYGHLEWNSNEANNRMRKLAEAKGLAKKLSEERYNRFSHQFHESFSRENATGWLEEAMKRHYPNAKPVDEKLYSYFFKKAREADEKEKAEDKKRLYYLLDKYVEYWWN